MALTSYLLNPPETDAVSNLALEEQLLEAGGPEERFFLVYRDGPAVIIGKNQDPALEVAAAALAAGFPPVIRRISGGGTVYHDLGNLNFSFIAPAGACDKDENLELIGGCLRGLGIPAEATAAGDLYLHGRKITGTARCLKRRRFLQHGTLLVEADLAELERVLDCRAGAGPGAVASRPARVVNLAVHSPGITASAVAEKLLEAVESAWAPCARVEWPKVADPAAVEARAGRYRSREWTFRSEGVLV